MLRGCGGGTGGSLGGAGGGGGAVPTALQLLWSSLAPHPVEEMPLLLKEGENAPLLSGKVPPKGESPPLIPLERGAPSIQVFLVSPRVVTKDNLCVQVSVHVYCVVNRAPATELLAGILPKILGDPNRDCKGLVISDGTLLWIYRRLIGRSYIALARQDQYIGNISDPLGRLRF